MNQAEGNDAEVDLSEEVYEELEQESEAEDTTTDLSCSGLRRSIQQPERDARRQLGPILNEEVIRLFPGSPLQNTMNDQAARAQDILNKIRETREHIDSATTIEILRESDLRDIRENVEELEAETASIQVQMLRQRGGKTSAEELKEIEKVLQGDFRLVAQRYRLL